MEWSLASAGCINLRTIFLGHAVNTASHSASTESDNLGQIPERFNRHVSVLAHAELARNHLYHPTVFTNDKRSAPVK